MTRYQIAAAYARLLVSFHQIHSPKSPLDSDQALLALDESPQLTPVVKIHPFIDELLKDLPKKEPIEWTFAKYFSEKNIEMLGLTTRSAPSFLAAASLICKCQPLISNLFRFSVTKEKSGFYRAEITAKEVSPYSCFILKTLLFSGEISYLKHQKNIDASNTAFEVPSSFAQILEIFSTETDSNEQLQHIYEDGKYTLRFNKALAEKKNHGSDSRLWNMLNIELDKKLAELPREDSLSEQVYVFIQSKLEGNLNLDAVCEHFFTSKRTLSRLLRKEDTSFTVLLNEARKDCAMKLIKIQDIPLKKISSQAGFGNISLFSSKFKSWTGETPAVYREKNKQ